MSSAFPATFDTTHCMRSAPERTMASLLIEPSDFLRYFRRRAVIVEYLLEIRFISGRDFIIQISSSENGCLQNWRMPSPNLVFCCVVVDNEAPDTRPSAR